MMKKEFIELTGFEPTEEEYRTIEADYYRFNGDKQAFCKDFVRNGSLAVYANARQRRYERTVCELKVKEKEVVKLQNQVLKLQRSLDKELEWKPAEHTGTNLSQKGYEDLRMSGGILTDAEAIDYIHREFGFDPAMIVLKKEVCTYEVNKYRRLRKSEEYEREPLYFSSDWNYIRFDCGGYFYEVVNGELEKYYC